MRYPASSPRPAGGPAGFRAPAHPVPRPRPPERVRSPVRLPAPLGQAAARTAGGGLVRRGLGAFLRRAIGLGIPALYLYEMLSEIPSGLSNVKFTMPSGWNFVGPCFDVPPVYFIASTGCLQGQIITSQQPIGANVGSASLFGFYRTLNGFTYYQTIARYSRPTPGPVGYPGFRPYPEQPPIPSILPQVDPLRPPGVFEPIPQPVPYELIPHLPGALPDRSPTEGTVRGGGGRVRRGRQTTVTWSSPPLAGRPPAGAPPSSGGGKPDRGRRLSRRWAPRPKRRRGREEEKKTVVLGVSPDALIRRFYDGATEVEDAILAVAKAIPGYGKFYARKDRFKRVWGRTGTRGFDTPTYGWKWEFTPPSTVETAKYVWRNRERIVATEAMANLVYEWASDRTFGAIGQLTTAANQRKNTAGGLALGPAL